MKKLLNLFCLLIAINGFSQAIVLLDEDFEGSTIPTGWTTSITYGNHDWSFGSGTMPGNSLFYIANFPNNAAIFNDDAAGGTDAHNASYLISPEFSVADYPLSNLDVKLRYHYAINNKGASGDATFHGSLNVRIEDNASHGYNFIASHNDTTDPVYHWIDIKQFLINHPEFDLAHLKILWAFDDHGTNPSFGWGVGVDDIALMVMPKNDTCANAIPTIIPGYTLVSNVGSTDSGIPAPSCGAVDPGDIWFKVTVPATGSIILTTDEDSGSPLIDTVMSVYSGTCGNLQEIACNDDMDINTYFSNIELSNQTPGDILYVRIFTYFGDPYGSFYLWSLEGGSSVGKSEISGFNMYPNPAKNILHLKAKDQIDNIEIFNLMGQKVMDLPLNNTQSNIDISNLAVGTYILKVMSEKQIGTYHFIKN